MSARTRLLVLGFFFANLSNFMVIPLLALYLHLSLGEAALQVGLVLTGLIVTQQSLPLLTGFLSDRWGSGRVLSVGIASRSLGFIGFAITHDLALLLVAAMLVGFGGAAFTPAAKAMIAQAAGTLRPQAFALRYMATNAGAAIGPPLGGVLFGRFQLVCLAAAAIYLSFWLFFARTLADPAQPYQERPSVVAALRALASDRRLQGLTAVSVGFWFLYTQFTFTIPLYGQDRFGLAGRVAALFALNAVLVILLQFPLAVRASAVLTGWRMLAIGAASLAAGFTALVLIQTPVAMILFVILFSLGEILVIPTLDTLASALASTATTGSYLGFVSTGWALGGLVGTLGGGALYAGLRSGGTYRAFWILNVVVALATTAGFLLLERRHGERRSGGRTPRSVL